MDSQPDSDRFEKQLEELFREAAFKEFFGRQVFDFRDQDHYLFPPDQKIGDAVCLLEKQRPDQEEQYEILSIAEERKSHPNPIVPRPCTFHHCVTIPDTWFEDGRVADIKSRIADGGTSLGKLLNKAFADVMLVASSDSKTQLQGEGLDDALSRVYSDLVKDGFHPDVILFPEHLEARLVQRGVVNRDHGIQNRHYVGTTHSGQKALWSSDLPDDTAVMLDTSVEVVIQRESRFFVTQVGPFTLGVCGTVRLNPIIKNTSGVAAIEGIGETLGGEAATVQRMTVPTYIDQGRIAELQSITSPDHDLTKLVRLCEEINTCNTSECYLATAMLVRALVDHVPPIFDQRSFSQVANNYASRSIKGSLQNLQKSLRHIADAHLHQPVRSKESLPNRTQVDFSRDLDVLLSEIVRVLK